VPLRPVQHLLAVDGLKPQVRVVAHHNVCKRARGASVKVIGAILRCGTLTVCHADHPTVAEYRVSCAAPDATE
jgi:hypothetical protein